MSDYGRKLKTTNGHLQSITGARFVEIDGSVASTTVVATGGVNLMRATINTKGITATIRSGQRQVAVISGTAAETDLEYGIYLENGLQIDNTGTGSITIVFDR